MAILSRIPASLLFLFGATAPLAANDTSLHDGRFGPEPISGGESPVRMVAEHIEVGFGFERSDVHCTFTFRNTLKDRAVEQLVGFPDVGAACEEAGRRDPEHADVIREEVNTARLMRVRTLVDGKEVKSKLQFGEVPREKDFDETAVFPRKPEGAPGVRAWYTMRVAFPPGKDVTIERYYTVDNGFSAIGVHFFHYTTATGGVWKGTIGRMQADVTLRDRLTVDRLKWPGDEVIDGEKLVGADVRFATQPDRPGWKILDPTHLRLVWTDFEPRTEKNHRGFTLSRPHRQPKS